MIERETRKKIFHFFYFFIIFGVGFLELSNHAFKKKSRKLASSPDYSFGGSCSSNGPWVNDALGQMELVKNTVNQLQGDECKELSKIITTAFPAKGDSEFSSEANSYMNDIHDLRAEILNTKGSGLSDSALVDRLIKMKTKNEKEYTLNKDIRDKSLFFVKSIIDALPKSQACLYNNIGSAQTLIGNSINAIVSYSGAHLLEVNDLTKKLLNFLQDSKYSNVIEKLDQSVYWNSLSCLMESTSEMFCKAEDAKRMLEFSEYNDKEWKNPEVLSTEGNPLEGYFLLIRELQIVTEWIQKVQYGVTPRLNTDADYKNKILENMVDLLQLINDIIGNFQEKKLNYRSLGNDVDAKRNLILKILEETIVDMSGGNYRRQREARGLENFFNYVVSPVRLPFYLVGRIGSLPVEVVGGTGYQGVRQDWKTYFQNGGDFIREFSDPDSLLNTIEVNIEKLNQEALKKMSEYFRTRFIVDIKNLVDESLTSSHISVEESFRRIYAYIQKITLKYLKYRSIKGNENKFNPAILTGLQDTQIKVGKVLNEYDKLNKINKKYLGKSNLDIESVKDLKEKAEKFDIGELAQYKIKTVDGKEKKLLDPQASKKKIKSAIDTILKTRLSAFRHMGHESYEVNNAYNNLIDTVYTEMNILIERESFFIRRLNQAVRYDYAFYVKSGQLMDAEKEHLLMVAGDEIIKSYLVGMYGASLNELEMQVNSAQILNLNNLIAIENTFGDALVPYLEYLYLLSEGESVKALKRKETTFSRFYKDSFKGEFGLGKAIWNLFAHGDRYETPSLSIIDSQRNVKEYAKSQLGKMCILALTFENQNLYYKFCKHSVIDVVSKDKFSFNGSPLFSSYASIYSKLAQTRKKYLDMRKDAKKVSKSKQIYLDKEFRDVTYKMTCEFRDWKRRNKVHYLIKEFRRD